MVRCSVRVAVWGCGALLGAVVAAKLLFLLRCGAGGEAEGGHLPLNASLDAAGTDGLMWFMQVSATLCVLVELFVFF